MRVYVCSPYRGTKKEVEENIAMARRWCKKIALHGDIPVAPHLFYPQFFSDDDENERELGLKFAIAELQMCDEMYVIGSKITNGMQREINSFPHGLIYYKTDKIKEI